MKGFLNSPDPRDIQWEQPQEKEAITNAVSTPKQLPHSRDLLAENAALAQQVESFRTVTDNARCQSGSEPEDLQAFIEGLWAEKAGLAQRMEQEKQRADLNESIARARDVIVGKLGQQVEELKMRGGTCCCFNGDSSRCPIHHSDKYEALYAEAREALCSCNHVDRTKPDGDPYNYTCEWCKEHPAGAESPPVIKQLWAAQEQVEELKKQGEMWIERYGKRGVELVNDGWQLAHDPASCGHPRACWLDRNYPESERNYNPETNSGEPPIDYRCIMCEAERQLAEMREALRKLFAHVNAAHIWMPELAEAERMLAEQKK